MLGIIICYLVFEVIHISYSATRCYLWDICPPFSVKHRMHETFLNVQEGRPLHHPKLSCCAFCGPLVLLILSNISSIVSLTRLCLAPFCELCCMGAELSASCEFWINGTISFIKWSINPMHKIDSTDSAKLPTSCGSWKTFTGTFTGMLTASELEGFLKKPAAFGTAQLQAQNIKWNTANSTNLSRSLVMPLEPTKRAFCGMRPSR